MKSLDETHSFDKGKTFDRVSIVATSVLASTEMENYHVICNLLNLNTFASSGRNNSSKNEHVYPMTDHPPIVRVLQEYYRVKK